MTIQLGMALRNNMIGQYESTAGASPRLQIRSSPPPASCAAADVGSLGADLTLPSDWMASANNGTVAKTGAWTGTAGAAIVAQHYRLKDTGAATCHEQGLVSEAWAPSKVYVLGQQVHNGGNVYRCTTAGTSAPVGGPAGVGASISDGSAGWQYLQTGIDLDLGNTVMNAGQSVVINTWDRVQGGA